MLYVKFSKALPPLLFILTVGLLLRPVSPVAGLANCVPPPSGLVSWWPGDGNTEDIIDSNHGALGGGATFANGEVDQAFSLDGIDSHIRIPDEGQGSDLDGFSQLTIDAWIKPSSTSESPIAIVSKYDSTQATGVSYHFDLMSGKLRLAVFQSVSPISWIGLESSDAIGIDTWSHVAGVWRGGAEFELYVNGEQVSGTPIGDGPPPAAMANNDVPVNIGRYESFSGSFVGPTGYFSGLIDEVQIFNRDLSASEIQAIFEAGSEGQCKVAITTIEMDIRPGNAQNIINLRSRMQIAIAILTTDTFDAATVDTNTVRFGATGTEVAPVRLVLDDVDGDGDSDMLLFFRIEGAGIECGDTSASLSGMAFNGQAIEGTDSITIVGCH